MLKVLGILNVFAFILYGFDKRQSVKHRHRISENILIFLTLLGGVGALSGMMIFRHKTRKLAFKIFGILGCALNIYFILFYLEFI